MSISEGTRNEKKTGTSDDSIGFPADIKAHVNEIEIYVANAILPTSLKADKEEKFGGKRPSPNEIDDLCNPERQRFKDCVGFTQIEFNPNWLKSQIYIHQKRIGDKRCSPTPTTTTTTKTGTPPP